MESMLVEVVGLDVRLVGTYDVVSYTVHTDGRLTLALMDGNITTFEVEEWMDVRVPGGKVPES